MTYIPPEKGTFDTKTVAEARRETVVRESDPNWFCPLIKGRCNKQCVCIGEPFIREQMTGKYKIDSEDILKPSTHFKVFGYYCTNAMFIGNKE